MSICQRVVFLLAIIALLIPCFQVYGFLHGINRNKATILEVLVDRWPDFNVIICRPDPKVSSHPTFLFLLLLFVCHNDTFFTSQNKRAREFMKKVTYYSTDEEALRTVLTEENAFDWRTYFIVGGEFRAHHLMPHYTSSPL